ncbi:hypothetical protein OF864_01230 [Bacillus cereus]|uniref:hypothetical protein n=1 Tax=Bacillus TaxID=1386 RepID=UPI0024B96794|nr:hypothetical protein [Bacillus cereus]WHS76014.1 hypothetical protein OF864_01230 [Bacillus cereus]
MNNKWTAKERGYDAEKQVSDIERYISVYTDNFIYNIDNGSYNGSLECHPNVSNTCGSIGVREKYAF